MKDTQIIYQGRLVDKEGFRVFIYNSNGDKKLVNSYDEYDRYIKRGDWYPEELLVRAQNEPTKRRGRQKKEG